MSRRRPVLFVSWLAATCVVAVGLLLLPVGGPDREQDSEPVAGAIEAQPSPAAAPPPVVTTRTELREFVRQCEAAGPLDVAWLRRAALESPDALVAGNALRALGRKGLVADDPELLALLDDERPRVRQEIVVSLALAPGATARRKLEELAAGSDAALAQLARHAARASLAGLPE